MSGEKKNEWKLPPPVVIDPKEKYGITDLEERHFDLKEMLIPFLQHDFRKIQLPFVNTDNKYEGIDYERQAKAWEEMKQERIQMDVDQKKDEPEQTFDAIYFYIRSIHVLLKKVGEYYKEKNCALLEVQAPVNICGDTHGQFVDLIRIFNACGAPSKTKYLFLGDYIDRGRHSVEVIIFLFCLKLSFPRKMHLLRGNHELKTINKAYGFWLELKGKFRTAGDAYEELHEHFNEVFSYMPLAGCVSKRILCMHGGISPHLNSLDDIREIKLPLTVAKSNPLACDLLWADPEVGVKNFEPNKIRAISHIFGKDQVDELCQRLDIDLIVRAHQVVEYGYAFFANQRLITVFSASRYQYEMDNYAAIVQVNKHLEISFTQLKPSGFEFRPKTNFNEQVTGNVTEQKEPPKQ